MASLNKVTLIGNLGDTPEKRFTAKKGTAVATVSLATSDVWKDKETNEKQERTEWHRVVFWGKLAEIACEHLTKGSQIYIEGANRTRKWTDDSGVDRYTTEVVATDLKMLGKKPANEIPTVPNNFVSKGDQGDFDEDSIQF